MTRTFFSAFFSISLEGSSYWELTVVPLIHLTFLIERNLLRVSGGNRVLKKEKLVITKFSNFLANAKLYFLSWCKQGITENQMAFGVFSPVPLLAFPPLPLFFPASPVTLI